MGNSGFRVLTSKDIAEADSESSCTGVILMHHECLHRIAVNYEEQKFNVLLYIGTARRCVRPA